MSSRNPDPAIALINSFFNEINKLSFSSVILDLQQELKDYSGVSNLTPLKINSLAMNLHHETSDPEEQIIKQFFANQDREEKTRFLELNNSLLEYFNLQSETDSNILYQLDLGQIAYIINPDMNPTNAPNSPFFHPLYRNSNPLIDR